MNKQNDPKLNMCDAVIVHCNTSAFIMATPHTFQTALANFRQLYITSRLNPVSRLKQMSRWWRPPLYNIK